MDSLFVLETISNYNQYTIIMGLFFVAVLYLSVSEETKIQKSIIWYLIFILVTVLNEIFARLFVSVFDGDDEYYRFIWTVPMVALTAYAGAKITLEQKKNVFRGAVLILIIIIIFASGSSIAKVDLLTTDNIVDKISTETIEVIDVIKSDSEEENPVAMLSFGRFLELRQYDASIMQPFTRVRYQDIMEYEEAPQRNRNKHAYMLVNVVNSIIPAEEVDKNLLKDAMEYYKLDYIVINKTYDGESLMENVGCVYAGETEGYLVYRYDKE